MTTLGELIDHCRHLLSGMDAQLDTVSALKASIDTAGLTLTLESVDGFAAGMAEVGLEQIRLSVVDPSASTVTAWAFGRGYNSTAAASHPAGCEVRFNPTWPAATVARAINGVLTEVYPTLFAVRRTELDVGVLPVPLPVGTIGVLSVWLESDIHPGQWDRVDRWDFTPDASGVSPMLRVAVSGHVAVNYATHPGLFDLAGALTQDFATVTGLPARVADLVGLGVAYRLVSYADSSRLGQVTAAQLQAAATGARPYQAGMSATKTLYAEFQARLASEGEVLSREHPIRLHKVR